MHLCSSCKQASILTTEYTYNHTEEGSCPPTPTPLFLSFLWCENKPGIRSEFKDNHKEGSLCSNHAMIDFAVVF